MNRRLISSLKKFRFVVVVTPFVNVFTKRVTTTTDRNFFKLLINLLSIGVATNNVQYPSVGITKKFNNMQRVSVGGKLIDLEKAVKHNVRTIVKFYQKKWPANKLERLLPNDPLVNVSMMMEKTFQIIGKYHTTYKKNGMSCGWVDRESHCDMKHPHQVFLLQNLCMKLTFDTETKMRAMTFKGMNPNDPEPWKRFFHMIPACGRPASASCVGWGDGKATKPDAKKRRSGKDKNNNHSGVNRKKEI